MQVKRMQVNHINNPLGFSLGEHPTFSWVVDDALGTCAEASRVVVMRKDEVVADTGWAALDAKACALDIPLAPRTRYTWTVSVRSNACEEATSAPSWFETGKMGEPWEATWLTCAYDEPRHPVFSRALELASKSVASARLYACGLGVYEAHINGCRASEERLAPGTHAYDKWLQVQTYDVTALVANGAELSFALGHGWYSGRFGFVYSEKGFYGNDWRLIAELRVTYADGTEQVLGTDESWRVTRSNVTFSNIYDGEMRDDTLPVSDCTPAELLDGAVAARATSLLCDRLSLPVLPHETFLPQLVRTPSGDCVLDLGQNIAGTFRLHVEEPSGTRIRLQFGELLQDGEFYRDNLRTAKAEYTYVSDGGRKTVEPFFTFYGYRYVRVEIDGAAPKTFDPARFTGIALYSDFDTERARINTGMQRLTSLSATRAGA